MMNEKILKEIRNENKRINRNIQRLSIIGLMAILGNVAKEAKKNDDAAVTILAKAGLMLAALAEVLVLADDIIDMRKARIETELDEFE